MIEVTVLGLKRWKDVTRLLKTLQASAASTGNGFTMGPRFEHASSGLVGVRTGPDGLTGHLSQIVHSVTFEMGYEAPGGTGDSSDVRRKVASTMRSLGLEGTVASTAFHRPQFVEPVGAV